MLIRRPSDIPGSEITAETDYLDRRRFIGATAAAGLAIAAGAAMPRALAAATRQGDDELTPLESAFIAGCVKAPNRYNPFMQKTDEDREQALRRARIRTNYVLRNMVKLGHMTSATYEAEVKQEVPFNKGTIRYPINAILDKVRARMEKPTVKKALFS